LLFSHAHPVHRALRPRAYATSETEGTPSLANGIRTIYRWLKKKHRGVAVRTLFTKYGRRTRGRRMIRWGEGSVATFVASRVRVQQYKLGWQKTPDFANTSLESPVHNKRCTPGLERGARKPAGES